MRVVEHLPRLDVADLKSLPEWPAMKIQGTAQLHIQNHGTVLTCKLNLVADKATFGPRMWFECPQCGARRKHLLFADSTLGCRSCLGAHYIRHA